MKASITSRIFSKQCAKIAYKSIVLMLLPLIFLFSCKQTKRTKETPKNLVITLQSDGNTVLKEGMSSITVSEGSKWRDVYSKAKDVIKEYKEGWEEGGFRLENIDGKELERYSDYEFNSEVTIFIFAKRQMVSIYVDVDEGYTLIQDNNIKIGRFSLWKDIKDDVESLVRLKEDYNKDCWKVSGDELAIKEDMRFDASSTTVIACSKIKDEKDPNKVTLTVMANEGFDVASQNTLRAHKKDQWGSIRDKAYTFLTLKEDYVFVEWRKGGATGDVLEDSTSFDANEIVFAVAKKEECSLSIMSGEGYRLKDAELFNIEKNTLWKDIKGNVEKKIEVLKEYTLFEWRVDAKNGNALHDAYKFSIVDKPIYLYPICKKKNIRIKVKIDEGYILKNSNDIILPNPSSWKDIKKEALKKIEIKEYYDFTSWHMRDGGGEELKNENLLFDQDTSVFAKSSRQKVDVTVQGGLGCNIVDANFTALRGLLWKNIKNDAENKLGLNKEFYYITAWYIAREDGTLVQQLHDSYRFVTNKAVVKAITKQFEVSISIIDSTGSSLKKYYDRTITVGKGNKWGSVKAKAWEKIKILDDYEFVEWCKKDNSSLADDYIIKGNLTVYAKTKLKDIEIRVMADEGFNLESNNIIRVPINSKWSDVKKEAEKKIKIKKYWSFDRWRLNSVTGSGISYYYQFRTNTTIFATSTRDKIEITVRADGGYWVTSSQPITISKGSKWSEIYPRVKNCVSIKYGYQELYWKKNTQYGTNDDILKPNYIFENNLTVWAISQRK